MVLPSSAVSEIREVSHCVFMSSKFFYMKMLLPAESAEWSKLYLQTTKVHDLSIPKTGNKACNRFYPFNDINGIFSILFSLE